MEITQAYLHQDLDFHNNNRRNEATVKDRVTCRTGGVRWEEMRETEKEERQQAARQRVQTREGRFAVTALSLFHTLISRANPIGRNLLGQRKHRSIRIPLLSRLPRILSNDAHTRTHHLPRTTYTQNSTLNLHFPLVLRLPLSPLLLQPPPLLQPRPLRSLCHTQEQKYLLQTRSLP